ARLRGRPAPSVSAHEEPADPAKSIQPVMLVGGVLLLGAVLQGARGQMRSYPFACYPTFQWRAPSSMPDLGLYAVDRQGQEHEIVHARNARGYRTQRQWAELWSLSGVYGPVPAARLRAYLRAVLRDPTARREIEESQSVRF